MATSAKSVAAVRETRKGATIHKTNERPGTRAQVRYVRASAYKAREVLDLIRGLHVADADEVLEFTDRGIATVIRKALASAVANAVNNDSQDPETLVVSACYADEGPTLKRWRPRARGRATRIRKRTCHITIIVSRMSDEELRLRREREDRAGRAGGGSAARASRKARVAKSRKAEQAHDHDHDHDQDHEDVTDELVESEATEAEPTETEPTEDVTDEVAEAEVAEVDADEAEGTEPEAEADDADDAEASADEPEPEASADDDAETDEEDED